MNGSVSKWFKNNNLLCVYRHILLHVIVFLGWCCARAREVGIVKVLLYALEYCCGLFAVKLDYLYDFFFVKSAFGAIQTIIEIESRDGHLVEWC